MGIVRTFVAEFRKAWREARAPEPAEFTAAQGQTVTLELVVTRADGTVEPVIVVPGTATPT